MGSGTEVRDDQRLSVMDTDATIPHDPHVRMATLADMDVLLPACVDMFTEEVGISPVRGGAGSAYRDRVAEIVRAGRSFVRIVDGRIEFKAEIGRQPRMRVRCRASGLPLSCAVGNVRARDGVGYPPGSLGHRAHGVVVCECFQHTRDAQLRIRRVSPLRALRHRAVLTTILRRSLREGRARDLAYVDAVAPHAAR